MNEENKHTQIMQDSTLSQECAMECPQPKARMRGWLVFFFVIEILFMTLAVVGFALGVRQQGLGGSETTELLKALINAVVLGWVLYAFLSRRNDAAFTAMSYIGYGFLNCFVTCMKVGLDTTHTTAELYDFFWSVMIGIVWNSLWLIYFHHSKQVARRCPKEQREITPLWWLTSATLMASLIISIL